ncbi:MAG: hypothetical protein NT029_20340, partial [Armatimonadetes bacterium]|nr:hypothetical protein [Armatimonadota bacterium]
MSRSVRRLQRFARWLAGPLSVSLLLGCVPAAPASAEAQPLGQVRSPAARRAVGPRLVAPRRPHAAQSPAGADGPEIRLMGGGGGENHVISVDPAPGTTYSWEGTSAGTNTGNGNKLTRIPLVGWTACGGMPVEFALYHNSQGTHNSELGYKWTFSYDIYSAVDAGGNVTVHWGD